MNYFASLLSVRCVCTSKNRYYVAVLKVSQFFLIVVFVGGREILVNVLFIFSPRGVYILLFWDCYFS